MSLPTKLYAWKDTSATVQTYYTDTTSVTIGTHLYNNQGVDTGKTVDYISGSTFNVAYKLTVVTNPSDATVTFNTGTVSGKTCTVPNGSSVTYTVARTGYVSQSVTTTVNQENKTESKTLAKQNYTLKINTTPADATVTFSTGVVSGHTCTVPYDTTVTYTISKTNYVTSQTQTVTITQDQTINAPALVPDMATLIVETDPADATVTFSTGTVEGHNCTVQKGTSVSYNISNIGYITSQTYTKTVTQNETVIAPALVQEAFKITYPDDARLVLTNINGNIYQNNNMVKLSITAPYSFQILMTDINRYITAYREESNVQSAWFEKNTTLYLSSTYTTGSVFNRSTYFYDRTITLTEDTSLTVTSNDYWRIS